MITVGLSFWKQPRRVIYAVNKQIQDRRKRSYKDKSSSDSEDDDFVIDRPRPRKKTLHKEDYSKTIMEMSVKMAAVLDEIDNLKAVITDTLTLTRECGIPLPFMRMMRDSFKCKICHKTPPKPPLIASKCCKVLLGCEGCVNSWYSGADALTKACPSCRHERGYNETMQIRGLDEFLTEARDLIHPATDASTLSTSDQDQ